MTEKQIRQKFVETAEAYLGCKESDGSHKKIIDLYNTQKPLPRGYAVQYTDEWCATFVSAIGVELGWTDIILPECSCNKMIELYKAAGRWQERDDYIPAPGDLLLYDWQDNGRGDNTGSADHIAVVVAIIGGTLNVIEGNKHGAVEYRALRVNNRYIRGYCLPDFASKVTPEAANDKKQGVCDVELRVLKRGAKGADVKALQTLLIGYGYSCGKSGADGDFGPATSTALRAFQKACGLIVDGICGAKTWAKLLGIS